MKVALLHGPAIVSSRQKLSEIKCQFLPTEVIVFEKGSSPQEIVLAAKSGSLFSKRRLLIVENPSSDLSLKGIDDPNLTLVLWFDHEVDAKKWLASRQSRRQALQNRPASKVYLFPEAKEVSVFPFLDFLANSDKQAFPEMVKLKGAGFESQYFITMVFYLLRSLVATPKNAPHFVRNKLQRQRANFTLEDIKNFYHFVLIIDFKIKSGLLEETQAEVLLVNRFLKTIQPPDKDS